MISPSVDAKRAARESGSYSTFYIAEDGQGIRQTFRTKEQNDNYANGLKFMGIDPKKITKSFYHPIMKSWHPYSHDGPEPGGHSVQQYPRNGGRHQR